MKQRPSARGFTLIELMIVVTIIGILSAISYPSYQNYVIKNRRAGIEAYMVQVAAKQEQYVLDARAYAAGTGLANPLGLIVPTTLQNYYTVDIAAPLPPPLVYTITATATSVQAGDGDLTLDSTGAKTPAAKW